MGLEHARNIVINLQVIPTFSLLKLAFAKVWEEKQEIFYKILQVQKTCLSTFEIRITYKRVIFLTKGNFNSNCGGILESFQA